MRKTLVAASAGFLIQAGDLHAQHLAQAAASPIRRDAFVRVIARPHAHWQQGRVVALDSTRLILELAEKERPLLTLPLPAIDSIELRYSVHRASNAVRGAAIGVVAGGLALGGLGAMAGRHDAENWGFLLVVPGAMFGAILGAAVGSGSEKRWAPVGLTPPSVPPARN